MAPLPRPFLFYANTILATLYLGGTIHFFQLGQIGSAIEGLGLVSIFGGLAFYNRKW